MPEDDQAMSPADFPEFPPQDENGVDLEQIASHLRMTPAERLTSAEQYAEFVLAVRRANGIEWFDTERS
jgi:hypothetical protein